MTQNNINAVFFLSFCIEQYKKAKSMSGSEVVELFDHYGVTDYLYSNYEILHTQGSQWLMEEIDNYIFEKGGTKI